MSLKIQEIWQELEKEENGDDAEEYIFCEIESIESGEIFTSRSKNRLGHVISYKNQFINFLEAFIRTSLNYISTRSCHAN